MEDFTGSAAACEKSQTDGVTRAIQSILIREAGGADALIDRDRDRSNIQKRAAELAEDARKSGLRVEDINSLEVKTGEAVEALIAQKKEQ